MARFEETIENLTDSEKEKGSSEKKEEVLRFFTAPILCEEESKSAYEVTRDAISEIAKRLEELEKQGILSNPRIILFGSAVYATREPTDVDIQVVCDSSKFDLRDSMGGMPTIDFLTHDGNYISNLEVDFYQTQDYLDLLDNSEESQEKNREFSVGMHRIVPDSAALLWNQEITKEDFEFAYYLPILMDISLGGIRGYNFPLVKNLEDSLDKKLIEGDYCDPTNVARALFEKFSTKLPKLSDPMNTLVTDLMNTPLDSDKIKSDFGNIYRVYTQDMLPSPQRKFGTLVQQYISGKNPVQSALISGAQLLYGDNIEQKNGKNVFDEVHIDREFLSTSHPKHKS